MGKIAVVLLIALAVVFHLYWQAGFPYTHDGENHVARFADYAAAVRQRQIPPRLAPNIWSGVSYPVFIFNYPLSNILSLPFSAINIDYTNSFKTLAVLYVLVGGMGMWLWFAHLNPTLSIRSKAIGVLAWLSFPFLISTIYFRGNIGEIAAYGLLPWLFLGVEFARSKHTWYWLILTVSTAFFLLSHNIAAVFVWPLVIAYALFRFKEDWSLWKRWLWPAALGAVTTTWFWLPAIFEKQYTALDSSINNAEAVAHAPTFWQLLSGPLQFGFSYPGTLDTLSFSLGITWWVLVIGILLYLQPQLNKTTRSRLSFLLPVTFVLILLQLIPFARIWSAPVFSFIQFPWRLSLFLGLPVAGLTALVWQHASRLIKYLIFILLLAAFWEIALLKPVDYVYKTSVDFASFPHSTTTQNENKPKSFTGIPGEVPPHASITTGQGSVQIELWKGHEHTYAVTAESPVVVTESTLYYPGWKVLARNTISDEIIAPDPDPTLHNGWLSYALPAGNYHVTTRFGETTWPRILGDILSLAGIAGILMTPIVLGRRAKD